MVDDLVNQPFFSDDLIDFTKSLEVRKAGDRSSRTITVL